MNESRRADTPLIQMTRLSIGGMSCGACVRHVTRALDGLTGPVSASSCCQHNAPLGRVLKTSFVPVADCFLLLAVGPIPLLILEIIKGARHARRQRTAA